MRSLFTVFAAVLLIGCEPDRHTDAFAREPSADAGRVGIRPPFQLRTLDPAQLSLAVDVNGTIFRMDRPDDAGRWVIRPTVDPGQPVNLVVEWRGTVGGPEGPSILLALLSVRRPPVSAGDSIDVDREDYDTSYDEDRDGATNLEEAVFGSDPFAASDAPPAGFTVDDPATDATQDSNASPSDAMVEALPVDPERGPADVPGSAFYRVANNSARLQGPLVGGGTVSTPSLAARSIPFQVASSDEGLEVLRASVVPAGDFIMTHIILLVANRSTEPRCLVKATRIAVGTTDGEREIATLNDRTVNGSVGLEENDEAVGGQKASCVGPGSTVYLHRNFFGPPDSVADLTIESLESNASINRLVDSAVEPVSYRVGNDAFFVRIANRGEFNVELREMNVFFLDEEGHPIGHLLGGGGDSILGPGEEVEVPSNTDPEATDQLFPGSASSIRVIVNFRRIAP